MQSSLRELHFDRAILHIEKALRLGTMLLRSAHRMRKSQADTWTKNIMKLYKVYDKQNKVRLTHSKTFEQK